MIIGSPRWANRSEDVRAEPGDHDPLPTGPGQVLDVTRYAAAATAPQPPFDRDYTLVLDRTLGFLDGVPGCYPINGQTYPHIPDLLVREGSGSGSPAASSLCVPRTLSPG